MLRRSFSMLMVVMVVIVTRMTVLLVTAMLFTAVLSASLKLYCYVTYSIFTKLMANFLFYYLRLTVTYNVHCCKITLPVNAP